MKVKILLATLAFIIAAEGAMAADPPGLDRPTVAVCMDGDTFQLQDRRMIRLAGIDAPEKPRGEAKAQYYSRKSRRLLESLIKGKQIELSYPGVKVRDNYGRLLVEARVEPDAPSINEQMVAEGAAFFYPHQDLTPEFQQRLAQLQNEAIQERRGMWAYILSHPVASQRYLGNKETLRFYPENCEDAGQIKPRNREYFDGLMDAFLAGYAPSRICPFWPNDTVDRF